MSHKERRLLLRAANSFGMFAVAGGVLALTGYVLEDAFGRVLEILGVVVLVISGFLMDLWRSRLSIRHLRRRNQQLLRSDTKWCTPILLLTKSVAWSVSAVPK
jgi:hypothetical protein